jgi:NAD(P)H-hydrate epimerase
MIPVLTATQMREIDSEAIGGDVATGFRYMRRAGTGLLKAVRSMLPDPGTGDIAIVCGKGNNGGDGYVLGTLLLEAGYGVMCFGLCDKDEISGEALRAYEEFIGQNGNFLLLRDVADAGNFKGYALIVDAMLGTGIKGNPRGLFADVIRSINASPAPVLAIDTPSGLDNETGIPGEPCIRARSTVTMGFPKIGAFFFPGRANVGELVICDLEYPYDIVQQHYSHVFLPTFDELKTLLPHRKPAGSKFDHGVALAMCGSRGMTGSATLVSLAALRTGCGMVHCAAPESAIPVLSAKVTEPVLHGIAETNSGTPAFGALEQILDLAKGKQALCIGPGISHEAETSRLVRALIAKIDTPVVLDADGINAFKGHGDDLKKRKGDLVLTPHRGEWERLFGALPENHQQAIAAVQKVAREQGITVLLKGSPSIVADAYGRAYVLPFGSSALATAGSGDVLSGIITSLIAQGSKPIDAALLGAFIHGKAGEIAGKELTEYSVMAGDVITRVPNAIHLLIAD